MQEQEGDNEPAHHARRPMNAFLIFCKRHRSVVRDRYPNLENRSITKILGEWWANLEKEEKACYTGLAKQYKDAFFNANPDFKWYKLPAPPLRTLSSRPRDINEKTSESPTQELYHESELEKTNNNSTKIDLNKKSRDVFESKTVSMFTPGKLADEAQMGGLSRLLDTKTETQSNPFSGYRFNSISEHRSHFDRTVVSREDALQDALSETTRMFEEDEKGVFVPELNNSNVIDQVVNKIYEDVGPRNWSDDEKSRSGRSCKGKRYQEFMAVGGLIMNKRQRRENDKSSDEGYNASCSWDPNMSETVTDYKQDTPDETAENEPKIETEGYEPDNNGNKTFKAADFDLDAKIAALPSLSLEKFQQRKRDNKRRKKTINLKPKVLGSSHIINSVPTPVLDHRQSAESWREHVIGSQKRKPRKISITRFEINSLVSSHEAQKVSPEIKLATEAPCTIVHSMDMCKQIPSSVDLFALATLAEVASNTSKIDGATAGFIDALTAKAIDKNASTV